jgi:hypothetical protein
MHGAYRYFSPTPLCSPTKTGKIQILNELQRYSDSPNSDAGLERGDNFDVATDLRSRTHSLPSWRANSIVTRCGVIFRTMPAMNTGWP